MKVPKAKIEIYNENGESELYSIAGWFIDASINTATAFGGYFRFNKKYKLIEEGQLTDIYGSSTLEGKIDDNLLEFEKRYSDCKFIYKFKKQKGIWVGRFEYSIEIQTGDANHYSRKKHPAKAITTLIEGDASQIICRAVHHT